MKFLAKIAKAFLKNKTGDELAEQREELIAELEKMVEQFERENKDRK